MYWILEYSHFTYCFIQITFVCTITDLFVISGNLCIVVFYFSYSFKVFLILCSVVDLSFLNQHWESQKISSVCASNFISSALVNILYLPLSKKIPLWLWHSVLAPCFVCITYYDVFNYFDISSLFQTLHINL
jgi:hypothetical protein